MGIIIEVYIRYRIHYICFFGMSHKALNIQFAEFCGSFQGSMRIIGLSRTFFSVTVQILSLLLTTTLKPGDSILSKVLGKVIRYKRRYLSVCNRGTVNKR